MRKRDTGRTDRVVTVSIFRAQCNAFINQIGRGRLKRLVITKFDRPVATLVGATKPLPNLRGALKGTVFIPPDVDITEPTGEVWDAERDKKG